MQLKSHQVSSTLTHFSAFSLHGWGKKAEKLFPELDLLR